MTHDGKIKEISMENLNQAERKISAGKVRKALIFVALALVLVGGGYAIYAMLAGDVVGTRFTVNKMMCPACVITVTEAASKLPGVVDTGVSLAGQEMVVTYREKKLDTERIKNALVKAGYPAAVDGTYKLDAKDGSSGLVAFVNGRPIFKKDLAVPWFADKGLEASSPPAVAFFDAVGKEILLQAADKEKIVIQPQDISEEMEAVARAKGGSTDELQKFIGKNYESEEKYSQIVAQRLGIRRLMEDHVAEGIQDPTEKNRKIFEWVGLQFKDADVKIIDPTIRAQVHTVAGQDDWKTFWPRMIGSKSQLKTALTSS